jgi:hypothetical protein
MTRAFASVILPHFYYQSIRDFEGGEVPLPEFERQSWRSFAVSFLAPLLMTLFFLQGMRVYVTGLYVTVWNIVWIPGSSMLPLLTLLVFVFPLLALVVAKKATSRVLAVASTICISICSLILGFGLSYKLEMLLSSLVVGFYGIFFPFYLSHRLDWGSFERSKIDLVLFTCGFALALSFDLMFRAFGATYYVGVKPTLLPLKLMLAIVGAVLGVLMHGESLQRKKVNVEAPLASRTGGILIPSGVGALFFMEFTIFANPNGVLRWTQTQYSVADLALFTPMLMLAASLATLVLTLPYVRSNLGVERRQTILLGNLIIFASVICLLFVGTWLSAVIVLVGQFFMVFSLYAMLRYLCLHEFRGTRKSILAASSFLGLIILLLWDFMYAFSFAHAFLGSIGAIFEGQLPFIVLSMAGILWLTSTLAALKTGGEKSK